MDKNASLFVNDGSFLERFKQLQQEKEKKNEIPNKSRAVSSTLLNSAPKTVISKTAMELKSNCIQKTIKTSSSGKLAFSLKQKSKLVAPAVKLDEDEDEDVKNHSDDVPMKRQKLGQPDASYSSPKQVDVVPPFPSDPTVRKVADKLASFVAKNGRQFEHVTRQKNPGDTPFKFLFDESCSDFKYYEYRLREEQTALSETRDSQSSSSGGSAGNIGAATPSTTSSFQASYHQHAKYHTPASALFEATESAGSTRASSQTSGRYGESSAPTGSDPIAMMEYYMKKAAAEEMRRPPKASKDEMPPPASLQAPVEKGHHMGDFIPPEELDKFFASCNDASAQKALKEMADKAKIQADNVGHKLLSRMGWREGEGLGSSRSGISVPIMAGEVKKDHLGVGAHAPGEVTADDDIYEQYKKRMMLGYRHRPNPLNNPRKSYY
ncbi:SURP and G-patch domain-containing protein 1-like protein [Henckelia pumila]|uniref:SURP and G-patch domain-containing protein 1-like protein n=1 Tax=Henckelia pumila TaxID=405737 RepID=UPI003C6DF9A8